MNLSTMKDLVTSKAARQILLTQKHSPKILFIAGTVGVVGATVLACRATLKVSDILEQHEKHVGYISEEAGTEQISHEEANKRIARVKLKTAVEIAKPYALPAGLLLASIGALTGSHVILTRRNTAVVAAYAAVDRAYKQYRENVIEKYGEDEDNKLAVGTKTVHIEEKLSNGNTKVDVKAVADGTKGASPYSVIFDEQSRWFSREPGANELFLSTRQSWATDKLRANGHLFLNEAYDLLGLPRTKAGAVVGWVYRHDSEKKTGDNYVSFGVFEGDTERIEAFFDGVEDRIWLDFNVDGIILDLI